MLVMIRVLKPLVTVVFLMFLSPLSRAVGQESSVQRLTSTVSGEGGNGNSISGAVSANGRYLAFDSFSDNLVSDDTNSERDIFIKDLQTGAVTLISRGRFGIQSNGASRFPRLTPVAPNGFFAVVYESLADNIGFSINGDTNNDRDIYISMPTISRTLRLTRSVLGGAANASSFAPSIAVQTAPTRLFIAYMSHASNLTSEVDANGLNDIFLTTYTRPDDDSFDSDSNRVTVRVSKPVGGGDADGPSKGAEISGDGKWIVFESEARNLIPGQTPVAKQIYLYEISTGKLSLVSKTSTGAPGNGESSIASINYDGTYISYLSSATDILSDGRDTSHMQVVRYNRTKDISQRVNITDEDIVSNGSSVDGLSASISPNGRFVVFSDTASNLAVGDANGLPDVYLKDMITGSLFRLSHGLNGADTDGASSLPLIAGDSFTGDTVLSIFTSTATDLVTGDDEGATDIFLASLKLPPLKLKPGTSFQVPPDVALGEQNAILNMERLKGLSSSSARASTQMQVQYVVDTRIEGVPKKNQDRQTTISKRNRVAVKKLKPAVVYQVKYKAQAVEGTKVVFETKFSPPERFQLGE